MLSETKNALQEIGLQLDRGQFPHVYNGGVVKPSDSVVVSSSVGEESNHASKRQRRPKTRSRQRAAGWQREACGTRSPGKAASVVCSSPRDQYEPELKELGVAYPETKIWRQAGGLWLKTESSVLAGLEKKATLLSAISFASNTPPKSWAFWTTAISTEWIGPRHTNFPDGSICAYEPQDRTWVSGDSIVQLFDLYSLWALRHEHLKIFGRWPGFQSAAHPYERLEELRDDEFCGCNNSEKLYRDCCKAKDLSSSRIESTINFMRLAGGSLVRKPPQAVLDFLHARIEPPCIDNLFQ